MSNKTKIQAHNELLNQIMTAVTRLPSSKPWGGSSLIVPGTSDIDIPAFTDTELTVSGEPNLLPRNIRQGIDLFGVLGTLKEGQDVDLGSITPSAYSFLSQLPIPTSKKRNGLLIAGSITTSGYSSYEIYSTSLTQAFAMQSYRAEKIEITFNNSNISLKASASIQFDGYSTLYYCALNM